MQNSPGKVEIVQLLKSRKKTFHPTWGLIRMSDRLVARSSSIFIQNFAEMTMIKRLAGSSNIMLDKKKCHTGLASA